MKPCTHSVALIAFAFIVTLAVEANAGGVIGPAPVSLSVDEAGHGRENFADNSFALIPGALAPDTFGPGGRASALTYQGWLFTNVFTTGDLFLTGPGGTLDVIRFNYNSATLGVSLVFYSLPGAGQLADTGFPSAFYSNTFSLVENPNGTTTYTPAVGQPGRLSSPFTYIINTPAVPEGGRSICLLALGLLALLYGRWREARS